MIPNQESFSLFKVSSFSSIQLLIYKNLNTGVTIDHKGLKDLQNRPNLRPKKDQPLYQRMCLFIILSASQISIPSFDNIAIEVSVCQVAALEIVYLAFKLGELLLWRENKNNSLYFVQVAFGVREELTAFSILSFMSSVSSALVSIRLALLALICGSCQINESFQILQRS